MNGYNLFLSKGNQKSGWKQLSIEEQENWKQEAVQLSFTRLQTISQATNYLDQQLVKVETVNKDMFTRAAAGSFGLVFFNGEAAPLLSGSGLQFVDFINSKLPGKLSKYSYSRWSQLYGSCKRVCLDSPSKIIIAPLFPHLF